MIVTPEDIFHFRPIFPADKTLMVSILNEVVQAALDLKKGPLMADGVEGVVPIGESRIEAISAGENLGNSPARLRAQKLRAAETSPAKRSLLDSSEIPRDRTSADNTPPSTSNVTTPEKNGKNLPTTPVSDEPDLAVHQVDRRVTTGGNPIGISKSVDSPQNLNRLGVVAQEGGRISPARMRGTNPAGNETPMICMFFSCDSFYSANYFCRGFRYSLFFSTW